MVDPNGGRKKFGFLHTGVLSDFFSFNFGGLSRNDETVHTRVFSDFASIPGVYLS